MDKSQKYIDIHSHVLPGIDDGPRDFESAMALLRLAAENQIGTIICTPHYKEGMSGPQEKKDSFSINEKLNDKAVELINELNTRIAIEKLGIKLHSGNELFYTESALSALEEGRAKTLAASDFVLVEFAPWATWDELQDGLFNLKSSGYQPILAHAERYECLNKGREERNRVFTLRDYGIMIQINAEAVLEKTKFTKYLLKNELADFVATDAHSNRRRGPYLKVCGSYLNRKYGADYTSRLLYENARKLL
ncbi:MAG: hypothetical protein FWE14_04985 [Lachnospiraceae bacterium]|nr:hypothetical protein [Lachnospiraceae bacterium]